MPFFPRIRRDHTSGRSDGRAPGTQCLATAASLVHHAPERALEWLLENPYGLDALFTARTATLDTGMSFPTGERVSIWSAVPEMAHWLKATLLWTGIGLVALWAAASRHRERRRA